MADRNNNIGLHLQSDGNESPFQRSNNMPLTLGSKGIDHFTNWNNKINSLGGGDAPWYADNSIDDYPTDVDIVDDIAVVSYGNYHNTHNLVTTGEKLDCHVQWDQERMYDVFQLTDWQSAGFAIPAPQVLMNAIRSQSVYNQYGYNALNPTNCNLDDIVLEIVLDGTIGDETFSAFAGQKITLEYGGGGVFVPTETCPDFYKLKKRPGTEMWDPVEPIWKSGEWGYWMGAEYAYGANNTDPNPDYLVPFVNGTRGLKDDQDVIPVRNSLLDDLYVLWKEATNFPNESGDDEHNRINQIYDSCVGESSRDGDLDMYWTQTTHAKLKVGISSIVFKKTVKTYESGKVEIYQRKRGFITSIAGNVVGIGGADLEHGDIIKISSALSSNKDVPLMNGIKYVKKVGSTYSLYNDVNFIEETDTSNVRTADGITWAAFGNKDSSTGETWQLYTTLTSPLGFNGYSSPSANGWIHASEDYYGSFNFGCDSDIKKWKTEEGITYYSMVVGERGHQTNILDRFLGGAWARMPGHILSLNVPTPDGTAPTLDVGTTLGEGGLITGEETGVAEEGVGAGSVFQYEADTGDMTTSTYNEDGDFDYGGDTTSGDLEDTLLPQVDDKFEFDASLWYQFKRSRPSPDYLPHGRAHVYVISVDQYGAVTSTSYQQTIDASSNDPLINSPNEMLSYDNSEHAHGNSAADAFNPSSYAFSWFPDWKFLDFRNLYWYKAALSSMFWAGKGPNRYDGYAYWDASESWGEIASGQRSNNMNLRWEQGFNDDVHATLFQTNEGRPGDAWWEYNYRLPNDTFRYLYPPTVVKDSMAAGLHHETALKYSYYNMSISYCFVDSFGKSVAVDIIDGDPMFFAASNVKTHLATSSMFADGGQVGDDATATRTEILDQRSFYSQQDGGDRNVEFLDQLLTPEDSPLLAQATVGYIHSFSDNYIKVDRISNVLDKHLFWGNMSDWESDLASGVGGVENYNEYGQIQRYYNHVPERNATPHLSLPDRGGSLTPLQGKMASWCHSLIAKDGMLIYGQPTVTFKETANNGSIICDYNLHSHWFTDESYSTTGDPRVRIIGAGREGDLFTEGGYSHDIDPSSIYVYNIGSEDQASVGSNNKAGNRDTDRYCVLIDNIRLGGNDGCFPRMVQVWTARYGGDTSGGKRGILAKRYTFDNEITHSLSAKDTDGTFCKKDGDFADFNSTTTQQRPFVDSRKNTFGYNIKYDSDIIVTNAFSFYSTSGPPISPAGPCGDEGPTDLTGFQQPPHVRQPGTHVGFLAYTAPYQDYVFILQKEKRGFAHVGRLSPAEKNGTGRPIGDINYDNNLANSYTKFINLTNRYDTFDEKIILDDSVGYAVFDRNSRSKRLNIEDEFKKSPLENYFVYNEVFRGRGKSNFNLNNIYKYNFDAARGFSESLRLKATETGNNTYMYFFKVPLGGEDDLRVINSVQIEFEVENISTFVDGQEVTPTQDSYKYLPMVGLYENDIRTTIRQRGVIDGSNLLYGIDNAGQNKGKLYEGGAADEWNDSGEEGTSALDGTALEGSFKKSSTLKSPVYTEKSILDPIFTGTVTLDSSDVARFISYNDFTKDNYSRTFTNNDGNGNALLSDGVTQGTYTWTLSDASQESYSDIGDIGATLAISFGNWVGFQPYSEFLGSSSETATEAVYKGSDGVIDTTDNYFIENEVRIKSVTILFEDRDPVRFMPFLCDFYEKHNLSSDDDVDESSIIRFGRSQTAAYFDQDSEILTGTFSRSIQILHVPQNKTMRNLDVHQPESLNLHMVSFPVDSGVMPLATSGHVSLSSGTTLFTSGVYFDTNSMPLKIGPVPVTGALALSVPQVFGFHCSGTPLYSAPPGGPTVTDSANLYIGPSGGANVLDSGVNLVVGTPTATGSLSLVFDKPSMSSGTMPLHIPRDYAIHNTIACVSPNLFLEGSVGSDTNMKMFVGKPTSTGGRPLYTSAPNLSSGSMPLMIASASSGVMPLTTRSVGGCTGSTTLVIADQADEASMNLFTSHAVPGGPRPGYDLSSGQTPLFVNSFATKANSLDDNIGSTCVFSTKTGLFDISPTAETEVSGTSTNNISRDRLLRDSANLKSLGYGLQRHRSIGSNLSEYTVDASLRFYRDSVSRESFDANGTYLAIAVNSNSQMGATIEDRDLHIFEILSDDSVTLKYIYSDITEDIQDIAGLDMAISKVYYKSVSISPQNKIAVAVRVEGAVDGLTFIYKDAILILELKDVTTITTSDVIYDECSFEPNREVTSSSTVLKWTLTAGFVGGYGMSISDIPNMTMGDSLEWASAKNSEGSIVSEKLYYGKQDTNFGSVYYRDSADIFATETEAVGFTDSLDYAGYQKNVRFLDASTKAAFGHKIKIYDDLMFVSAPLVDPYIGRKTLDRFEAASLRGAIYIFTQSNGVWSYVNSLYKGGYTAANVSDKFECSYETNLFGYDFDYDSDTKLLVVGEPLDKKVYSFTVGSDGTALLSNTYTGTSDQDNFGSFVAICNKSNPVTYSRGEAGDIHNLYSGADFNFGLANSVSEITSYVPRGNKINTVSQTVSAIRRLQFATGYRVFVARDFAYTYAIDTSSTLQKFAILDDTKISTPLYIAGPTEATEGSVLTIPSPMGTDADTLGIALPLVGQTGSMTLHMHNNPQSGLIPLHLRVQEEGYNTLFIEASLKPTSAPSPLYLEPTHIISTAANLSIEHPVGVPSSETTLSLRASPENTQESVVSMFIDEGTRDPIAVSENPSLIVTGLAAGVSGITGFGTVHISGGNSGPYSDTTSLVMSSPSKLTASGIKTLFVDTDPATGVVAFAPPLYLTNTQTSLPPGSTVGGIISTNSANLIMHSPGTGNQPMNLTLYRAGAGGGEELAGLGTLFTGMPTTASTMNLVGSGTYAGSNASMQLSFPVGAASGLISPIFLRGYPSG